MEDITLDRTQLLKMLRQVITATGVRVKIGDAPFRDETCRWYVEEGYKYDVLKKAKAALSVDTWSLENPEHIIECVKNAIWIPNKYGTEAEQNFISESDGMPLLLALSDKPVQFANVFYGMYLGITADEESFQSLKFLLSGCPKKVDIFAVIAYLFFIKDESKYVPLRKLAYQERLPILNLPKKYVEVCSWANYCVICSVMRQLAEFLREYFPETELINGQSFFWMFRFLKGNKAIAEAEFPPVEVFTKGRLIRSGYNPSVKESGVHIDHIKKALRNAETGKSGEEFVLEYEKTQGRDADWISQTEGDGLGYDIRSTEEDGSFRYIEVKATSEGEAAPFYITATELAACDMYGENYYLYRVYVKDGKQRIAWYRGKEIKQLCNCPVLYIVTSGKPQQD